MPSGNQTYTIIKSAFLGWSFYFVLIWISFPLIFCVWIFELRRQKVIKRHLIYSVQYMNEHMSTANTCVCKHVTTTLTQTERGREKEMWRDRYLCTPYRAHARTSHSYQCVYSLANSLTRTHARTHTVKWSTFSQCRLSVHEWME